jgi:pimeloyl-ACP methyl ester carboxylesterase
LLLWARLHHDMINESEQENFKPLGFEASALNLHTRVRLTSVDVVIVFVHGLGGSGYETWGDFPRFMFEQNSARKCDVGVFDYNSFHRRRFRIRPKMADVADSMAEFLDKLATMYTHVYIVGHSMGGLLALLAIKKYLDNYDRQTDTIKPIAGAILFGTPLAGSRWSPRVAWLLFREASLLRRHSPYQREIREFMFNLVESENIAQMGSRAYQFVLYSAYGDFDRWVKKPSATRGVIIKQRKSFVENHTVLVKPAIPRSPQEIWLSDILDQTTENREKIRFELHARTSNGRPGLPAASASEDRRKPLVVELLLEFDAHEWWNVCKTALRDASTDHVPLLDIADYDIGAAAPNLSLCVVDSRNVIGQRVDTSLLLERAQAAFSTGHHDVRIVVVGGDADDAKDHIINRLTAGGTQPRPHTLFIGTATDGAELYRRLCRYLAARSEEIEGQLDSPDDTDPQAGEPKP